MTNPLGAVVLLSGGLDSTTLATYLQSQGFAVYGLAVDYGQRHVRELEAAKAVALELGIPLCTVPLALGAVFAGSSSSQIGNSGVPVPHGHYAAESMKTTIVPNRNMLLIAVAGALAESFSLGNVAIAAHAGDHFIYPDCRPEFHISMQSALALATEDRVKLLRPFVEKTKTEIVALAHEIGAPYHLSFSCYEGDVQHCGACGTCVERKEAFREAGVPDPTEYKA